MSVLICVINMSLAPLTLPVNAPQMAPLKLVTMTVDACIRNITGKPLNLNLDVIARHMPLDDKITSIKYRNMVRSQDGKGNEPEINYHTETGSGRFKNQCTFVINVGEKNINTKFFNNGKMVNVGCKSPEHAVQTAEILVERICNMEGLVIYDIPDKIQAKNVKKFFKDDLRKKFGELIQLLICELDMDTSMEPFDSSLTADDSFKIFMDEVLTVPHYESDIMYLHTIINILKCYYDETTLLDNFNTPEFRYLLFMITEHTNREIREISCEFPSYLNNKSVIVFDPQTIEVVLINKSTNCGYYVNRTELVNLIQNDTIKCTFDKNRYPGVIAEYKTNNEEDGTSKNVKIIIFNTGKINITAARTHQQVQMAYEFISKFCTRYFTDLLLENEYYNKNKDYEDSLPSQFHVGVIENQQYYLLKKSSITSNPRNIRFLVTKKLLDMYR